MKTTANELAMLAENASKVMKYLDDIAENPANRTSELNLARARMVRVRNLTANLANSEISVKIA